MKHILFPSGRYGSYWNAFLFLIVCLNIVGFIELLMATLMYSFWTMLEVRWRDVCGDIAAGRLNPELKLDPYLEEELNKHLVPDPERARELSGYFKEGFRGIARRIWPNLR